jgi:hypothetical protein
MSESKWKRARIGIICTDRRADAFAQCFARAGLTRVDRWNFRDCFRWGPEGWTSYARGRGAYSLLVVHAGDAPDLHWPSSGPARPPRTLLFSEDRLDCDSESVRTLSEVDPDRDWPLSTEKVRELVRWAMSGGAPPDLEPKGASSRDLVRAARILAQAGVVAEWLAAPRSGARPRLGSLLRRMGIDPSVRLPLRRRLPWLASRAESAAGRARTGLVSWWRTHLSVGTSMGSDVPPILQAVVRGGSEIHSVNPVTVLAELDAACKQQYSSMTVR